MTRKLKETCEKWGLDMNLNKTKYLYIGQSHSNLKLDKGSEIASCHEYKYLGVIFDTSGTDDKEISSRVIQCDSFVTGPKSKAVFQAGWELSSHPAWTPAGHHMCI
jgi:hypothetical protein